MINIIRILDIENKELVSIGIGDSDYFIYEDKFGRKWKLQPITNENIMMPFIITPLVKET